MRPICALSPRPRCDDVLVRLRFGSPRTHLELRASWGSLSPEGGTPRRILIDARRETCHRPRTREAGPGLSLVHTVWRQSASACARHGEPTVSGERSDETAAETGEVVTSNLAFLGRHPPSGSFIVRPVGPR